VFAVTKVVGVFGVFVHTSVEMKRPMHDIETRRLVILVRWRFQNGSEKHSEFKPFKQLRCQITVSSDEAGFTA
jgi:hypothetical protein